MAVGSQLVPVPQAHGSGTESCVCPSRASKRSVPTLGYVLLGFESGKKDLLDWEWKDNSFLTDNEENFLRSLLVPRAPTSIPARVEGRGPIPIGVSTHLLSCAVMF